MPKHSKWHFPDEVRKEKKIMPKVTKTQGVMPVREIGMSEENKAKRNFYDQLIKDLNDSEIIVLEPDTEAKETTRLVSQNVARAATRNGIALSNVNSVTYGGKVHVRLFTQAEKDATAQRIATRAANKAEKKAKEATKNAPVANSRQPQPVGA